jgi:hypothetical protein
LTSIADQDAGSGDFAVSGDTTWALASPAPVDLRDPAAA